MARRWPQVAAIVALLGGSATPAIALTIERLPPRPRLRPGKRKPGMR
jgi:hypothetical protein